MITATLYSDPACPWAYSESPALRVIEWRYADQLDWKLVLVGLTESSDQYAQRGYTPVRGALGQLHFRSRYGMPFVARAQGASERHRARLPRRGARRAWRTPGREWAVFRAIQLANFNGPLVLEDDDMLRDVLREVPGRRRRRDHRGAGLARGHRGLPGRQGRHPQGRRLGRRAPGQDRDHRRAGPLHRALDRLSVERHLAGRRGLSARRGLRHPRHQPRSDAHAARAARDARRRCWARSPAGSPPRRSRR